LITEVGDDILKIVDAAQYRYAADRLTSVVGRRRKNPDRPNFLHGTAFDRAQKNLCVSRAAKDQRGRGICHLGAMQRARVVEIAIGDARAAQQRHLQEPVQEDGDLTEEELAVDVRGQQHVIERQQRYRQHGGGTEDIVEIWNGGKSPLVAVQTDDEVYDRRVDEEDWQEQFEPMQLGVELLVLEAHDEGKQNRRGGGDEIVQHDQNLSRRQSGQFGHSDFSRPQVCFCGEL
jgi:hypothetical protein